MYHEGNLANIRVLVTRPSHQAENLARLIEAESGEAIRFPTVEILEPLDSARLAALIDRLEQFDIAIFISPNAVNRAMSMITARRGKLPDMLALACVGRGSARELKRFGVKTPLVPNGRYDSEALLALPVLHNVEHKKVVIFRGKGGRELLDNTLRERGAHVEYAECYRRTKPTTDMTRLLRQRLRGTIDIVSVTSVEGVRHLLDMVGKAGKQWLLKTPVVVISERMVAVCRELGFDAGIYVADDASDESIVSAIKAWRASQNSL